MSSEQEHVVEPIVASDTLSAADVVVPTGGVGAAAPVLIAAAPRSDIDLALGADEQVESDTSAADDVDGRDRGVADELRQARRAARAKARAERAQHGEPALTITPAQEAGAIEPAPGEPPALDRDLVLNPFSE